MFLSEMRKYQHFSAKSPYVIWSYTLYISKLFITFKVEANKHQGAVVQN